MMRTERSGNLDELKNRLQEFSIRPVLTAHPTQFYPGRVLAIITDLTEAIQKTIYRPSACTSSSLVRRRFPKEKANSTMRPSTSLWYLQNVFYKSAGDITAEMRRSLSDWDGTLNLINLGFWPGGDRDGNPFVSVETTKKVADRLRDVLYNATIRTYAVSDENFL